MVAVGKDIVSDDDWVNNSGIEDIPLSQDTGTQYARTVQSNAQGKYGAWMPINGSAAQDIFVVEKTAFTAPYVVSKFYQVNVNGNYTALLFTTSTTSYVVINGAM
jgi:hypothetical protein